MIAMFLCVPDSGEQIAKLIGVNPRYVNLVEEDENSHGLIVLERRTLVCYDSRQQVVDALNAAERGIGGTP